MLKNFRGLSKNSCGFGFAHFLLMLVLLGLIGGVGYYVYLANRLSEASRRNAEAVSESVKVNDKSEESDNEGQTDDYQPVIPAGWEVYKNDKYGFSVAFPKEWGALSAKPDPGGDVGRTAPFIQYLGTPVVSDGHLKGAAGAFNIAIATRDYNDFKTVKAGTPLKLIEKDGREYWVASDIDIESDEINPGDEVPVPVVKKINGRNIYRYYSDYEGNKSGGLYFAREKALVHIALPTINAYNMFSGEKIGDEAAYLDIFDKILNTVDLY